MHSPNTHTYTFFQISKYISSKVTGNYLPTHKPTRQLTWMSIFVLFIPAYRIPVHSGHGLPTTTTTTATVTTTTKLTEVLIKREPLALPELSAL